MLQPDRGELVRCGSKSGDPRCDYLQARVWFEQERFDLAAPAFEKIAIAPTAGSTRTPAAMLALESLHRVLLDAEPPRPQCLEAMISQIDRFSVLFCGADAQPTEIFCSDLWKIDFDTKRFKGLRLLEQADRDPPNARDRYLDAAAQFRLVFDTLCHGHGSRIAPFGCDEIESYAANALVAGRSKDAKEVREAIQRIQWLMSPIH